MQLLSILFSFLPYLLGEAECSLGLTYEDADSLHRHGGGASRRDRVELTDEGVGWIDEARDDRGVESRIEIGLTEWSSRRDERERRRTEY